MILLIDNYDSFVHNLARYVRELGAEAMVRRNDEVTVDQVRALDPSHVILSPGPCTPAEAGISTDLVRSLGDRLPILGVCLGHQAIGTAYGGRIVRAGHPVHGKTSRITHDGKGVFDGVPSPLRVARYHSLVIERMSLPSVLRIRATDSEGEIMAVSHVSHPVLGVQFHPESAATEFGYAVLERFLKGAGVPIESLPTGADGGESPYRSKGARSAVPPWVAMGGEAEPFTPPPADLVH